jgi:hypothetical protein
LAASAAEAVAAPARSRASQTWAMLIKRVYELCEAQNYVKWDQSLRRVPPLHAVFLPLGDLYCT